MFYICKSNYIKLKFTMVNTEEFTKRLNKIMEFYDLSAASFADKIEVGRSSISHLLSGRNNPSLDFVMKITKTFPEVDLYWLLNGKGEFPKKTQEKDNPSTSDASEKKGPNRARDLFSDQADEPLIQVQNSPVKDISKIVIFYKDGTFDAFEN